MSPSGAAARLDWTAVEGSPGVAWCRAWTDRVDATLRALLGDQRGVAVIALGGYARQELCPASDIDLLLLHDGWHQTGLESLVERLCYPLWDARLSVGHAVRTPAEAVKDAGDRVDTATAVLDRRIVAGDRGLADALASRVQRWVRKRGAALATDLAEADTVRHEQEDTHPGMLEPDLKNGAGGLRDIHSLRWAAGSMVGEVGLDPLVAAGYLGATDRRRLARANATLLRARCALHLAGPATGGKDVDVLRLDRQDDVAELLGEPDADALLRAVGLATRTVGHLHDRTWRLVLADASRGRRRRRSHGADIGGGLHLADGLVGIDAASSLVDDPALGLRAVAAAAERDTHLSREAAARLTDDVSQLRGLRWTGTGRAALLSLLGAGANAADGLQEADHLGLLTALLPEWERVRGRAQRNPLHRFDLDTHGARAVVALHRLRRDESLDALWERQDDTASLLLGTWLHDVGKAFEGDHSIVGADVAARWLKSMGFDDGVAERVATLVRYHLLLPDVATRRDLDDPAEITKVAAAVRDVATLDALYLLSLADARATGPAAWSSWKAALMATLHQRVGAVLRGRAVDQRDPLRQARSDGVPDQALDALRDQAPARYFEIVDAAQVAAHARLLAALGSGAGTGVDVRAASVAGNSVVSVVTGDRPRLLADCAAVLAANDLGVLQARAITTDSGLALDWLIVTGEVAADALAEQLAAAVAGRIDAAELLLRPRRRTSGTAVPWRRPVVTVSDERTVEVEASDQPGLLYRLCAAIADAGHSLAAVRVSTLAHTVYDVFELTRDIHDDQIEPLRESLLTAAREPHT